MKSHVRAQARDGDDSPIADEGDGDIFPGGLGGGGGVRERSCAFFCRARWLGGLSL